MLERAQGRLLYGETSHWWVERLAELRAALSGQHAAVVHVVRSPWLAIKSMQTRPALKEGKGAPGRLPPVPPPVNNPGRLAWLCWYWRYWNERIEDAFPDARRVRVEDIRLRHHLNPRKRRHSPWTQAEIRVLREIVVPTMERYGYENTPCPA
jgi:hypothetical protein